MVTEHWPRGTQVTRLYERDSLALSLTRSSGETRAHRSPSARPAILTVRRLLYSNGFLPPFSSAEFCSAYLTLEASRSETRVPSEEPCPTCWSPISPREVAAQPHLSRLFHRVRRSATVARHHERAEYPLARRSLPLKPRLTQRPIQCGQRFENDCGCELPKHLK